MHRHDTPRAAPTTPSTRRDPLEAAARVARGEIGQEELAWLQRGFAAFVGSAFTANRLPLERCLGMPASTFKWRLQRRNYWLTQAAFALGLDRAGVLAIGIAIELQCALDTHDRRDSWRVWRGLSAPPAGASHLDRCLFHAAQHAAGNLTLSLKQLTRVLDEGAGTCLPLEMSGTAAETAAFHPSTSSP